ncbi:ABC transporter substrate-binding protein [Lutimaribacter sp. EGI FJ00015]|uniref:ABC transporter substrate-binding protein n=1 Tax=Lutimaribacter degradans TaxID=2945989 RepID=A0ACC5ZXR3_9RHOB|nr:ABC transporter substrate-binding protein [Lutimaribacter sp. EGI FJ00013]MCM2562993.1 ABC transporter substrate-binding protein [Lutimaribacter sp. EGI FJ00013]MCO0614161.1 ABC transporter substrate-binding protein [Lutimaribacter sp. EGI FJ00015]MCO0636138.1 ABC transporter substrate-binding protein [Lutimaribacter sp. EGI FJ00014]
MLKRMIATLAMVPALAWAEPDPADWNAVLKEARGQTVYWNAWGGSTTTNDFIAWVGQRVTEEFGVTLEHVKLSNTGDAVSRVLAEKQAGQDSGGAIDLIWINGPNFAAMKEADLLFGPFAEQLPNWALVDVEGKPVRADFTVPTDGMESPWATAQVVFMYDTADMEPLEDMDALLGWAKDNPGRFTYPQPPDFLGTTFLKQALYGVLDDTAPLLVPVEQADYDAVTAPLWDFLDQLTPHLWRQGRAYPQTGPRQIQLLADDEISLAISFSPGEASTAIAKHQLPDTVRTFVPGGGSIANASFVAIPYNASAKTGAMVVADFLLSPQVQARALDPAHLGYGTVLDVAALPEAERALFNEVDLGIATLSPEALGPALPEPHPSWMTRIEADWIDRYGVTR